MHGEGTDLAAKASGQGGEEVGHPEVGVAEVIAPSIGPAQGDGGRIDVQPPDLGRGQGVGDRAGDGRSPAGDVHHNLDRAAPERGDRRLGEELAGPPGNEDAGADGQGETGELDDAPDQGHRLARGPPQQELEVAPRQPGGNEGLGVEGVGLHPEGQGEEVRGVLPGDRRPPVVDGRRLPQHRATIG